MIVFGTDFDDTLYFHKDGGLHPEDVKAIHHFQECGNKFGLVSGRANVMKSQIDELLQGKIRFDFAIYSNGAVITDGEGNILHEEFLPEEFVREVVETMPDAGFVFHGQDRLYSTPNKDTGVAFPLTGVDSADFDPSKIYAVSFDFRTSIGQQVFEANKDRTDVILVPNSRYADFNPLGCTKGAALNTLAHQIFSPDDLSAAIGDSYNDLSMLEAADISFTFPTSPEAVQKAATRLVGGIDEAAEILLHHKDKAEKTAREDPDPGYTKQE